MRAVLAGDLGGSALKAALVDQAGRFLAQAAVARPLPMDQQGFSELDPELWWTDFLEACRDLFKAARDVEVVGVCLGGLTRTQVFLDATGRSIRPAITWADARAAREAERISQVRDELGVKTWGPINAYHTLARLVWLQAREPHNFARLALVLEPKDYLIFRLTGRPVGDAVSQARLLTLEGQPAQSLLEKLGLKPSFFPALLEPQDQAGSIAPGLPEPLDRLAGRPIFAGSMDAWLAAVGLGALEPGQVFNVSGTSEVLGLVTDRPREAPGLVTLPWGRNRFQIGGPSQAGADCLAWLAEVLDREVGDLLSDLSGREKAGEPLLFLPYLRGERTPLWEPDARGLFLGLGRSHHRLDLARAVIEGVALANCQVLTLAENAAGAPAQEVRLGGGAARSAVWAQIKADVLDRPVIRPACPESGLLGAAVTAFTGLGEFSDLAQAAEALVKIEAVHRPDPLKTGYYRRLYDLWLEVQTAGLELSKELVKLERDKTDRNEVIRRTE
ncbi:MAG: FGGY family carbohydrate kinase [Thermodesulfobacteriota bacterium]